MSVKTMGEVWELDLPVMDKLVALALADHADHNGSSIYPSNPTVAWKCGCSEDTVRRAKKRFLQGGLLVKVSDRPGSSTVFRMDTANWPKLPPKSAGNPPPIAPPANSTPRTATPPHPPHSYATPPPAQLRHPNHQLTTNDPKEDAAPSETAQRKARHQQFIAEWVAAYENDLGQTYRVTGRDAKAVKTLATEGHDLEELIWTARQAWKCNGPKHWNCQRAVTIYFYAEHLNEVRAELRGTAANRPAATAGERKF